MDVLLTAEVPKKKDWTCARDVIPTHSSRLFPLRIQQARIARISGAVRPQILSSLLLKLSTTLVLHTEPNCLAPSADRYLECLHLESIITQARHDIIAKPYHFLHERDKERYS